MAEHRGLARATVASNQISQKKSLSYLVLLTSEGDSVSYIKIPYLAYISMLAPLTADFD